MEEPIFVFRENAGSSFGLMKVLSKAEDSGEGMSFTSQGRL